jgi:chemotaxis signal transduction protein
MSAGAPPARRREERLLTFEVGGSPFALPIAAVAEVTEVGRIAAVPTLARGVAGVVNHHGDALPVLAPGALLPVAPPLPPARHLLVLARSPEDGSRFGVPVDCVGGLVDGEPAAALGDDPVAERRPLDGRVVSVLDPGRLLARALEVIERSADHDGRSRTTHEGEA